MRPLTQWALFLSPDITLLKSHNWDLMGTAQLRSRCLSEAGAPDVWGPLDPARAGSQLPPSTVSLWGVAVEEPVSRPWGRGTEHIPHPPCYPDGHFEGRGWKSLSVLPGRGTKASSG